MMSDPQPSPNDSHRDHLRERVRLRQKRKTTSCWPCRDRKVKCEKSLPCDTCVKRGYPDLCSYESPSRHHASVNGRPVVHSGSSASRAPTRSGFDSKPAVGVFVSTDGDSPSPSVRDRIREPFLGENAIPSFARDRTSPVNGTSTRQNVEAGFMPIIGHENTLSANNFLPVMADKSNIHEGLPSDRELVKIFQFFRTQLHPFTPILSDIDFFERQLGTFIDGRASQRRVPALNLQKTFSPSWMGLLYAVLASGVQFSDLPSEQRTATSSKYLQYSFQSLRLASFLVRPTAECLQAFIVLGNVLQNLMKPEAAWILLGTTIRIAQSLGLHQLAAAGVENQVGRKLWRSIVWQDTLLSLCFDRPPATITCASPFDAPITDNLSYFEAMYALQQYALEGMNAKMMAPHNFDVISAVIEKIDKIYDRAQEHLSSLQCCSTFQQRFEHYALRLHTSFVSGWLSRGAFRHASVPETQQQTRAALVVKGKAYLVRSLGAYLNLHPLCLQASRSWAYIHNGLSSALVLGLLGETKTNPEVRELLGALIDTLSSIDDNGSHQIGVDGSVALSKLHSRALAALNSLYNDHSKGLLPAAIAHGVPNESWPATNTNYSTPASKPLECPPETLYQSAENSLQHLDHNMGVSNAWEMSPMELFDSIIWDPNFTPEGFDGLGMNPEPWIF